MFLIGYGVFRSVAEIFREPEDVYMGELTLGISMGQWLSLPMIAAGMVMLVWAHRERRIPDAPHHQPNRPRNKAVKRDRK